MDRWPPLHTLTNHSFCPTDSSFSGMFFKGGGSSKGSAGPAAVNSMAVRRLLYLSPNIPMQSSEADAIEARLQAGT